MVRCHSCGTSVENTYRFCPTCGEVLPEGGETNPEGHAAIDSEEETEMILKLTLIDKGGKAGQSFKLGPQEQVDHILGREDVDLSFPDDEYISPRHARVYWEENRLWLQDLSSLNGVFVRIRGSSILKSGDQFLVGEQVLRFERRREIAPKKNKSEVPFSGSVFRPWIFKVVQVLAEKVNGAVWVSDGRRITLGREQGTVQFPYDQFMSREHCRLEVGEQACHLHDLQSRNGTYVRKYDRHPLKNGDYFFLGQKLLRVSIS